MNIATALRGLLHFAANVPTDDQLDARLANGTTGREAIRAARAALAEYDQECIRCEPGAIQCCGAECPVTRSQVR